MKKNVLFMIKDLQIKSFSDIENQVILDKVNLKIKKGENFGLIGETGSGKSMIGASLIDMIPRGCGITSGSIINYTNSPKKGLSLRGTKIAMISQDPMHALNPLQSIEKQFSSRKKPFKKRPQKKSPKRLISRPLRGSPGGENHPC